MYGEDSRPASSGPPCGTQPWGDMRAIVAAAAARSGRTGVRSIEWRPCAESWVTSGTKQAQDVVIEGLRRLEYRGYDSAGIALVADGRIASDKRAGKLANLEKAIADHPLPESTTGIGHTRWATHGAPNDVNAHPHLGRTRPAGAGAQRHHRELRRAARRARGAPGTSCSRRPTPRSPRTCWRTSWPPGTT